jgi:hypothetical protein
MRESLDMQAIACHDKRKESPIPVQVRFPILSVSIRVHLWFIL